VNHIKDLFKIIGSTDGKFGNIADALVILLISLLLLRGWIENVLLRIDYHFSHAISAFIETYIVIFAGIWHIILAITVISVAFDCVITLFSRNLEFQNAYENNDKETRKLTIFWINTFFLRTNAILIPLWVIVTIFSPGEFDYYTGYLHKFLPCIGLLLTFYYIFDASVIGRIKFFIGINRADSNLSHVLFLLILMTSIVLLVLFSSLI